MEPVLLGLTAPSLVSAAHAAGSVAATLTRPFAAVLNSALDSHSEPRTETTGIQRLRAQAAKLQKDLERRIGAVLERSGVSLDSPLRLDFSHGEAIEVDANHPQQTILEAALASDPTIASDLHQLVAARELLFAAVNKSLDSASNVVELAAEAADRLQVEVEILPADRKATLHFVER